MGLGGIVIGKQRVKIDQNIDISGDCLAKTRKRSVFQCMVKFEHFGVGRVGDGFAEFNQQSVIGDNAEEGRVHAIGR
jgi:hypothetical protein